MKCCARETKRELGHFKEREMVIYGPWKREGGKGTSVILIEKAKGAGEKRTPH